MLLLLGKSVIEQFCFACIQLSVLKSIEFPHNTSSHPGEEESKDALSCSTTQTHSKPLEVLLRERNKVLQSENTAPKVGNSELQGKATDQWSISILESELIKSIEEKEREKTIEALHNRHNFKRPVLYKQYQ